MDDETPFWQTSAEGAKPITRESLERAFEALAERERAYDEELRRLRDG